MSEFGDNYIILSDEEGNRYDLEHLYNFEFENAEYAVFLPAGDLAGKDQEMILFRVVYENNEEEYENIPEEDYERVYSAFADSLFDDFDR